MAMITFWSNVTLMAKQVNTMSTNQTTNAEKANVAKRIFNLIILDESGSMHGLEKMCVDGVNETIQTIKNAAQSNPEQKQMFSFITFSGRLMNEHPIRVKTYLEEITKVEEFPVEAYVLQIRRVIRVLAERSKGLMPLYGILINIAS